MLFVPSEFSHALPAHTVDTVNDLSEEGYENITVLQGIQPPDIGMCWWSWWWLGGGDGDGGGDGGGDGVVRFGIFIPRAYVHSYSPTLPPPGPGSVRELEGVEPEGVAGDFVDAIIVAMDMLIHHTSGKKYEKRVFLITDAGCAVNQV